MAQFKISSINDSRIKNALDRFNERFYYDCAYIDINRELFLSTSNGDVQIYMVKIIFNNRIDIVHFVAEANDSGNIGYIKIFKRDGIEKLINTIQNNMSFYGIKISSIEEKHIIEFYEKKTYYQLNVENY